MTTPAHSLDPELQLERRAVGWGLAVAAFVAVAVLGIGGLYTVLYPGPSRLDLANRCLTSEKRLDVLTPFNDPVAASATGGTLSTDIQSNHVTISLAGSTTEAKQLVARYRGYSIPSGRLTLYERVVAFWQRPPTQDEIETVRDCSY